MTQNTEQERKLIMIVGVNADKTVDIYFLDKGKITLALESYIKLSVYVPWRNMFKCEKCTESKCQNNWYNCQKDVSKEFADLRFMVPQGNSIHGKVCEYYHFTYCSILIRNDEENSM